MNLIKKQVVLIISLLLILMPLQVFAADSDADVSFTFSNSSVTASKEDSSYEISETTVTIKQAGTYEFTGTCQKGQIAVKKNLSDVTIILNNLTLSNDGDKAIKFKAGSSGNIIIKGNNTLSTSNDKGIIKAGAAENDNGEIILDSSGNVSGGSLTFSGDGTLNLSSDYYQVVNGEKLNCDAINCEGDLTVLSGTYNIDVTDDAIHSDYVLTIGKSGVENTPVINITSALEGLEGAKVIINNGIGNIQTTDDAVNAANKDLTSYNYPYEISINGGTWTMDCIGDGLDSNGSIYVNGGNTVIYCTRNGNGVADIGEGAEGEVRGQFIYTGGTLFASGMDMMIVPDNGTYLSFISSNNFIISKGNPVKITYNNDEIYSTTALENGKYILFLGESLIENTSYKLSNNNININGTARNKHIPPLSENEDPGDNNDPGNNNPGDNPGDNPPPSGDNPGNNNPPDNPPNNPPNNPGDNNPSDNNQSGNTNPVDNNDNNSSDNNNNTPIDNNNQQDNNQQDNDNNNITDNTNQNNNEDSSIDNKEPADENTDENIDEENYDIEDENIVDEDGGVIDEEDDIIVESNKTNNSSKDNSGVKTGDDTNIVVYIILLFISVISLMVLTIKRKINKVEK